MTNATHAPAHAVPKAAHPKADIGKAEYRINLTPEQYAAIPKPDDAPPRPQIELGGTGTAKAAFKDAAGGDVKIDLATWEATGPVKVTPDEKDPATAKIETTGQLGPAMVTVTASTVDGSAQASQDLMVTEKVGKPVSGTIDIAVQAPTKAKI